MTADRVAAFDFDGRHVLQDEDHLGLVNGRLTAGIPYRDVAALSGLWAPPFVSANFSLEMRVAGEKAPTATWTWRPFQAERTGHVRGVAVTSKTTLLYGQCAAVLQVRFRSARRTALPLECFALGWLDQTTEWGFARPTSRSETDVQAQGRRLTLRQGDLSIVVAIASDGWRWDTSGNLGRAHATLPAGQSRTVDLVVAIGAGDEPARTADRVLADPDAAVAAAQREYARQVAALFGRLPTLESDNAALVRWYHRSLVHFLTNRWDTPAFALQPYYSTGSIKGGCLASYLWNFGEAWEILPLYDPAAARSHIRQFLQIDLLRHFLFNPVTGAGEGPWYMVNQEKIIGLAYYYVLLTGDVEFLDERIDGRSVRDHLIVQAMFGDEAGKPLALIDYGPSNSHLELRRRYPYHHVMPDLNGRRYANYLRAATLCDLAGKPAPFLRERAALLGPLLKARLWDPSARWFRFEGEAGRADLRYTVQMFKILGSGVLDRECEEGLLSHLNETEFLSAWGLHSLSKRDPAFDQLDIDNGGGGICTSFPPQIIERLYQAGRPERAADLLSRLLWWGEAMPYWGDSIAAHARDYRRDTPLQCTFDGVAGAQCVIFGVFGVRVRPDGAIAIHPHRLPFARTLALRGLRLRGYVLDIQVAGDRYDVRAGGQKLSAPLGRTMILAADGRLRPAE